MAARSHPVYVPAAGVFFFHKKHTPGFLELVFCGFCDFWAISRSPGKKCPVGSHGVLIIYIYIYTHIYEPGSRAFGSPPILHGRTTPINGFKWSNIDVYMRSYVFKRVLDSFYCVYISFNVFYCHFGFVLGCLHLIFRCLDMYSGHCIPVVCLYSCWVSVYL